MRTQQELTALGEVLKTYELNHPRPSVYTYGGCFLVSLLLMLLALSLSALGLVLVAILPLLFGVYLWRKAKQAPADLSITLHQKGVNPICPPYNKAWLFEDIQYNYLFHTGPTQNNVAYNNLAMRRNDSTPWFVIPAELPEFSDFLQTYQTLYYEHRFPKLLKQIMLGQTVSFAYVADDDMMVTSLIQKTFDTPTKTLTLSQQQITIDGTAYMLADLKLTIIDKQKTYITLTDAQQNIILGNNRMGVFNHVLFIDLLIHLMSVQDEA